MTVEAINKKSLVSSFYSFLKSPKYDILISEDKRKIWTVFRLWALVLAVIAITEIPISILISYSKYDQGQNLIFDLLLENPLYLIIFLFYIWAPLSEELAFRMALKYNPYKLSFSFSILLLIVMDSAIGVLDSFYPQISFWLSGVSSVYLICAYVFIVLFSGFGLGVLLKKKINQEKVEEWYKNNFFYIFYASSFCFGMAHILNYYNFQSQFYILPLLIWPQFIIGLALGYVRMILGLRWSMFMHFLHNFIFSAPFLALAFLSDNLMKVLGESNVELVEQAMTPLDGFVITSVFFFSSLMIMLIVIAWVSLWREHRKSKKLSLDNF